MNISPTQYTGFDIVPLSSRESFIYIEKGRVDIEDGSVKILKEKEINYIPISNVCVIFLGIGTSITHEFAKIANRVRTTIIFVGEGCSRIYNVMGYPLSSANKHVKRQYELFDKERLLISRKLYAKMFFLDEEEFQDMSIEQMRGAEGHRVRMIYRSLCSSYKLDFNNRIAGGKSDSRKRKKVGIDDENCNAAMDVANTCLYGITESVILSLGLSPSIGFIHTKSNNALCLDIADTIKFRTVVPVALKCVSELREKDVSLIRSETRKRVVKLFRKEKTIDEIFSITKGIFDI